MKHETSIRFNMERALTAFASDHKIDLSQLLDHPLPPRYFRLNPRKSEQGQTPNSQLSNALGVSAESLEAVKWLPTEGFFMFHGASEIGAFSFARSRGYRLGEVYGLDAASGAAVCALDLNSSHHVLDLCCAPGAKLCMIADHAASVTGVDVSQKRLSACRNTLNKYGVSNARLVLGDGTTFALAPCPPPLRHDEGTEPQAKRSKQARGREKQRRAEATLREGGHVEFHLGREYPASIPGELYDRVLVDAECTHDGSAKHTHLLFSEESDEQGARWKRAHDKSHLLSPETQLEIVGTQKALLANGFSRVRRGGLLVYSTCSLTKSQNEEVVEWFLREGALRAEAEVCISTVLRGMPCDRVPLCHGEGYRFSPSISQTGGLFVCVILRKAIARSSEESVVAGDAPLNCGA